MLRRARRLAKCQVPRGYSVSVTVIYSVRRLPQRLFPAAVPGAEGAFRGLRRSWEALSESPSSSTQDLGSP